MNPNMKIFIGIFTAVLLLAFIPTYDLVFKDKIDSVEVVVVKAGAQIKPTETITKGKLAIERRRKQDLVEGVIMKDDLQSILGKDAADLLVGNAMLSTKMVDFDDLIPDESAGEAIRPILDSWVLAHPGSLRRKDRIDIYTIDNTFFEENGQPEQQSNVVTTKDEDDSEDTETEETEETESTEETDESSDEEPLEEVEEQILLKEPLLSDVRVAYAKDASNQEVTNAEGKVKEMDQRLNATGSISNLELILNEEDFQKLMQHVIDKKELIYITYN